MKRKPKVMKRPDLHRALLTIDLNRGVKLPRDLYLLATLLNTANYVARMLVLDYQRKRYQRRGAK